MLILVSVIIFLLAIGAFIYVCEVEPNTPRLPLWPIIAFLSAFWWCAYLILRYFITHS